MTKVELIARIDFIFRPLFSAFSPQFSVKFYSKAKRYFLSKFVQQQVETNIRQELNHYLNTHDKPMSQRVLWGIKFSIPIFNSAGMFKYGFGYDVIANQGAGAFLLGTTTYKKRKGNTKNGIRHPFATFPRSKAALNWMGLPNLGHQDLSEKIENIHKIDGCPIGVSLSADPEDSEEEKLNGLLQGLQIFEKTQTDFIEINESCPNVIGHSSNANPIDKELINRLSFISKNFLQKKGRRLPVIVKFSNDTEPELIPNLVELLVDLGFDGINLGNTSTKYKQALTKINNEEKVTFAYFTKEFGGGLSGSFLKQTSLQLSTIAVDTINQIRAVKEIQEFHVIRSGGIESYQDIKQSLDNGVSLVEWYTGYFSKYAVYGNKTYYHLFKDKL